MRYSSVARAILSSMIAKLQSESCISQWLHIFCTFSRADQISNQINKAMRKVPTKNLTAGTLSRNLSSSS